MLLLEVSSSDRWSAYTEQGDGDHLDGQKHGDGDHHVTMGHTVSLCVNDHFCYFIRTCDNSFRHTVGVKRLIPRIIQVYMLSQLNLASSHVLYDWWWVYEIRVAPVFLD